MDFDVAAHVECVRSVFQQEDDAWTMLKLWGTESRATGDLG